MHATNDAASSPNLAPDMADSALNPTEQRAGTGPV
jgi:hypothetical protein